MLYLLANLILIPPLEEILFRYGLYGKILKPKVGLIPAGLLVTIIYTTAYFLNDTFVLSYTGLVFLGGLLLVICYEYYGLKGAIPVHHVVFWGSYLRIKYGILPLYVAIPAAVVYVIVRIKREGFTWSWK